MKGKRKAKVVISENVPELQALNHLEIKDKVKLFYGLKCILP